MTTHCTGQELITCCWSSLGRTWRDLHQDQRIDCFRVLPHSGKSSARLAPLHSGWDRVLRVRSQSRFTEGGKGCSLSAECRDLHLAMLRCMLSSFPCVVLLLRSMGGPIHWLRLLKWTRPWVLVSCVDEDRICSLLWKGTLIWLFPLLQYCDVFTFYISKMKSVFLLVCIACCLKE